MPIPQDHAEAQLVVDERADIIRDTIIEAAHASMHTRKPGVDYKRWWSYPAEDMGAIYQQYRRAIKQYTRASRVHRAVFSPTLKAARVKWTATYKAAHRWAWRERCQDIQQNPGMLSWARWKHTLPSSGRPVLTSISNTTGTLPVSTHESLNNFGDDLQRTTVPTQRSSIDAQIRRRVAAHEARYTNDATIDSMGFACSVDDIRVCCQSIDVNRAYGCDSIHPAFLKHGGTTLYTALRTLFAYSYQHSVIPLQWTRSVIIPIYKDGDVTEANSYRPISLTSCVMRTMEHLVLDRLMPHIDTILHPHQYGFRPQHSTSNAIYHMLGDLQDTLRHDKKAAVPVVFIDLKKAFDRVWHDGLMDVLQQHGVKGRIWLWLRAFISNRFSCVASGQTTSDWYEQKNGVPQGAVLSPVLFAVFINKLARMLNADPLTRSPYTTLLLFADDGAFYPNLRSGGGGGGGGSGSWRRRTQRGLDIIQEWSMKYEQEVNAKKTQVVWFTRTKQYAPACTFRIGLFAVKAVLVYKYLGLWLQQSLRWTTHTDQLMERIRHDAYTVRRVIDHSDARPVRFDVVHTLCTAYLLPRWTYAIHFVRATETWMRRTQSQLCSTIRTVLALPPSTHTLSVLSDAGIMPLAVYRDYRRLRAAYNMHVLAQTHATTAIHRRQYAAAVADDTHWTNKQNIRIARGQPPLKHRDVADPPHIQSFCRVLLDIEQRWGITHAATDHASIKSNALRISLVRWKTKSPLDGLVLKSIKSTYERSHYLHLDTGLHMRTRARYRHNRIPCNASMYKMNSGRYNTTPTSKCSTCPTEDESIRHMIEDCPRYATIRSALRHKLNQPITIRLALGADIIGIHVSDPQHTQQTVNELHHTGHYLIAILVIRGFAII